MNPIMIVNNHNLASFFARFLFCSGLSYDKDVNVLTMIINSIYTSGSIDNHYQLGGMVFVW